MSTNEARAILQEIHQQRNTAPLSILKAAEPLLNSQTDAQPDPRQSNASSIESDQNGNNLTPATLSADLAHYKDLFSKLRFSYLEQVTKEKYLKNTLGAPPVFATIDDNAALEDRLSVMKAELQNQKRAAEALVVEIEQTAREIAERYDSVNASVAELEGLPDEVDELEREVEELKRQIVEKEGNIHVDEDPRMTLGMDETEKLLQERMVQNEDLQRQIQDLEMDLPARVRECEKAERELVRIEAKRNEVTKSARDAQQLREKGGRKMLEEQGRWYHNTEIVMKGVLGIEA